MGAWKSGLRCNLPWCGASNREEVKIETIDDFGLSQRAGLRRLVLELMNRALEFLGFNGILTDKLLLLREMDGYHTATAA